MSSLVWLLALQLGMEVACARWVQVGFLGEQMPEAASLVVDGQDHNLSLRVAAHSGTSCWISYPLDLPDRPLAPLAVTWQIAGSPFEQAVPLPDRSDTPVQVLLVTPVPEQGQPTAQAVPGWAAEVYPNPFNSLGTFTISLPFASETKVEIHDLLGRSLSVLHDGPLTAGTHRLPIDGSRWASGTYFLSYRLSTGLSGVQRLQLVK